LHACLCVTARRQVPYRRRFWKGGGMHPGHGAQYCWQHEPNESPTRGFRSKRTRTPWHGYLQLRDSVRRTLRWDHRHPGHHDGC